MAQYLMARGDEELHPSDISKGAWRAHMRRAELHETDERDKNGVGIIRLCGELSFMRGEAIFQMPEDEDEYRSFIEYCLEWQRREHDLPVRRYWPPSGIVTTWNLAAGCCVQVACLVSRSPL